MVYQIADDIAHQILSTSDDIRASGLARTTSMGEMRWLDRLYRHFPKIAKHVMDIQIDWPNRLPNTAIITLVDKRRYLYTCDPNYDLGTLEQI